MGEQLPHSILDLETQRLAPQSVTVLRVTFKLEARSLHREAAMIVNDHVEVTDADARALLQRSFNVNPAVLMYHVYRIDATNLKYV